MCCRYAELRSEHVYLAWQMGIWRGVFFAAPVLYKPSFHCSYRYAVPEAVPVPEQRTPSKLSKIMLLTLQSRSTLHLIVTEATVVPSGTE